MKCQWLFESDRFSEDIAGIIAEVKRQGMDARISHYVPLFSGETYENIYKDDACVFFYGTLHFAEQVDNETTWIPGTIGQVPNYSCSSYYPHLGHLHMAKSYAMYPYGELPRLKEHIYDTYAIEDTIFLRPDASNKAFTGQLLYRENFDTDLGRLGHEVIKPNEIIVVTEPREMAGEWRIIISDRKVIAASMYKLVGEKHEQEGAPDEAIALAEEVCKIPWQPDRIYCLDIFKTAPGNYYVGEIGAISTCGWYSCQREPIVREVSRIALEEWHRVHQEWRREFEAEV